MKLQELEAEFRALTGDKVKPYLFATDDVWRWLNQAQDEACFRADLLREADEPRMCEVPVSVGDTSFALDPRWVRITRAVFVAASDAEADEPCEHELEIVVDRRTLDERHRRWRTRSAIPRELLIERSAMRLGCLPSEAGTLQLEGFRLPGQKMTKESDEPEISRAGHLPLVQWAMKLAYEQPDTETRDPDRSARSDAAFSAYFGPARDVDLGQAGEQVPAFNRAY